MRESQIFREEAATEHRKSTHRSVPQNKYYHLALKKYRRGYDKEKEETEIQPQSTPYIRPFAYADAHTNGRYVPLTKDTLKHVSNMEKEEFEKWMKYYGSLRKIDLSITSAYTAQGAWAHTDCCSHINALPMRPPHTLNHEIEHVVADIFGLSQNEYWIDNRARDSSRNELRRAYVVVRGDIY